MDQPTLLHLDLPAATPVYGEFEIRGWAASRTPLRRVTIPAGSHLLRIDCTTLGRRVEQRVVVEPGAAITVFADVDRDPPALRVTP